LAGNSAMLRWGRMPRHNMLGLERFSSVNSLPQSGLCSRGLRCAPTPGTLPTRVRVAHDECISFAIGAKRIAPLLGGIADND